MELSDFHFLEILCKIFEDLWVLQITKWINKVSGAFSVLFLSTKIDFMLCLLPKAASGRVITAIISAYPDSHFLSKSLCGLVKRLVVPKE